jgi:hypothetical protein
MTLVDQVINLLADDPGGWTQGELTLGHKDGIEIWTSNIPYLNIGIYKPSRNIGFIDGIRLQLAVNRWHKQPLTLGG